MRSLDRRPVRGGTGFADFLVTHVDVVHGAVKGLDPERPIRQNGPLFGNSLNYEGLGIVRRIEKGYDKDCEIRS